MAENKGIMLAKSVQKHAGRAKEKILQNLGKVDRTSDEIFDEYLTNFNRQQQNANRLQKEFNNYIRCIRAAQTASKSLMDAIAEIYEPNWCGYDALQAQAQASESLWQDFAHKLGDQVLIPLNTYTGQFPEMKKKVEKRNRKLIDYDGQRHSYQSLQANANKRKDDVKLNKGLQQLDEARRTYEQLNTELHDELPALYESRILFLVTNLQTLFATEQVFHNETAKIYSELEAIVDKLATDSQCGSNALRKTTINAIKSASPVQSPVKQMNNANITNSNNQYQNTNGSANPPSPSSSSTQESRLVHNVSSTPEMNANRLVRGESGIKTEREMANESADAAAELDTKDMDKATTTTVTSQLNSPNANTSNQTTKTTTIEETTIKSLPAAAKALEETKTTEITTTTTSLTSTTTKEDVDMNNATATPKATRESSTTVASPSAEALAGTTEEEALKKSEQLNGNATANKDTANGNINNTTTTNNTTTSASTTTTATATTRTTTNGNANTNNTEEEVDNDHAHANKTKLGKDHLINDYDIKQKNSTSNSKKMKIEPPSKNPFGDYDDDHIDVDDDEEIYEVPKDATTTDLPPGVLYRVKATYGYVKEDVDELSFEVGDIIRVIEYEDPEDQEEGWLMGEKEGTNEKGLFPANFTRPI